MVQRNENFLTRIIYRKYDGKFIKIESGLF